VKQVWWTSISHCSVCFSFFSLPVCIYCIVVCLSPQLLAPPQSGISAQYGDASTATPRPPQQSLGEGLEQGDCAG
jgi:hypothetical protein